MRALFFSLALCAHGAPLLAPGPHLLAGALFPTPLAAAELFGLLRLEEDEEGLDGVQAGPQRRHVHVRVDERGNLRMPLSFRFTFISVLSAFD